MSEIKAYAEVVEQMRKKQKEYFQTRQRSVLEQSKHLEKMVDELTADILGGNSKNQLDLFQQ